MGLLEYLQSTFNMYDLPFELHDKIGKILELVNILSMKRNKKSECIYLSKIFSVQIF